MPVQKSNLRDMLSMLDVTEDLKAHIEKVLVALPEEIQKKDLHAFLQQLMELQKVEFASADAMNQLGSALETVLAQTDAMEEISDKELETVLKTGLAEAQSAADAVTST